MNDKIRKLYEEAKSFYLTDEYILEPSKEDCELIGEKFAELIVRECAEKFAAEPDRPFYGRHVSYHIKKQFGVKE